MPWPPQVAGLRMLCIQQAGTHAPLQRPRAPTSCQLRHQKRITVYSSAHGNRVSDLRGLHRAAHMQPACEHALVLDAWRIQGWHERKPFFSMSSDRQYLCGDIVTCGVVQSTRTPCRLHVVRRPV